MDNTEDDVVDIPRVDETADDAEISVVKSVSVEVITIVDCAFVTADIETELLFGVSGVVVNGVDAIFIVVVPETGTRSVVEDDFETVDEIEGVVPALVLSVTVWVFVVGKSVEVAVDVEKSVEAAVDVEKSGEVFVGVEKSVESVDNVSVDDMLSVVDNVEQRSSSVVEKSVVENVDVKSEVYSVVI